MRIPEILARPEPCFSFEFFPPKTARGEADLHSTLDRLSPLEPDFVSVTYGAAGSTREGTIETCERIVTETGIETMAHLSCVGETIQGIESILGRLEGIGVENVLVLRGDPPVGEPNFTPPEGGLRSSPELAAYIRARGEHWGIGGSAFPEIHPEAATPEADIDFLARKVDGGAEFLITQLFFENEIFFEWLERVRAAGIIVPVIAGLMPIISYERTKRLCEVCDAGFPSKLEADLQALDGDGDAEREFGVEFAIRQSRELLGGGASGLHFYTLNQAPATEAVLGELRR
ncbi:MAG: methylenetetrahydrofolate reductase [NAD(P)H] [Solirubrobacterales bacterium]